MQRLILVALLLLAALPARAGRLRIVADIAPVHSLVAAVAGAQADPALLLPPGASPHEYAMRPSEAGALAGAELVFWVGPALTPWLERPLANLSKGARIVALSEAPGLVKWPLRAGIEGAPVPASLDPHLWLDPENALVWLGAIEAALAQADPAHAAQYAQNAAAARARIRALAGEIGAGLRAATPGPYLVGHDAWQYFERRFELPPSPAIRDHEDQRPSPARIAALQALGRARGIACVLAEPPVNEAEIATVLAGRPARVVPLDPLGTTLPPGPGLYGALLRRTAQAVAACGAG